MQDPHKIYVTLKLRTKRGQIRRTMAAENFHFEFEIHVIKEKHRSCFFCQSCVIYLCFDL